MVTSLFFLKKTDFSCKWSRCLVPRPVLHSLNSDVLPVAQEVETKTTRLMWKMKFIQHFSHLSRNSQLFMLLKLLIYSSQHVSISLGGCGENFSPQSGGSAHVNAEDLSEAERREKHLHEVLLVPVFILFPRSLQQNVQRFKQTSRFCCCKTAQSQTSKQKRHIRGNNKLTTASCESFRHIRLVQTHSD